MVNGLLPSYLYSHLNIASQQNYPLRSAKVSKIRPILTRTKSFKKSFFLYCINVWDSLKADIRNAKSISIFKKLIVSKKYGNSLFSVYDPLGEKFVTRLRFIFSRLKKQKFRHGFSDTIILCVHAELTLKLRNTFFAIQRFELFDNLERAYSDFKNLSVKDQVSFILYGSKTNTSENFTQSIIIIV